MPNYLPPVLQEVEDIPVKRFTGFPVSVISSTASVGDLEFGKPSIAIVEPAIQSLVSTQTVVPLDPSPLMDEDYGTELQSDLFDTEGPYMDSLDFDEFFAESDQEESSFDDAPDSDEGTNNYENLLGDTDI